MVYGGSPYLRESVMRGSTIAIEIYESIVAMTYSVLYFIKTLRVDNIIIIMVVDSLQSRLYLILCDLKYLLSYTLYNNIMLTQYLRVKTLTIDLVLA